MYEYLTPGTVRIKLVTDGDNLLYQVQ